jgi:hypothetical protein
MKKKNIKKMMNSGKINLIKIKYFKIIKIKIDNNF